jgi:hypothetical protein
MNVSGLLNCRLQNTGLYHSPFNYVADAVKHSGAVQAQDYTAAKWALGLRVKNSTDSDIEKAFNNGTILRTHVMRPTWHFILPEDIRWLLNLTAPRVKSILSGPDRRLGLDDVLFEKSNATIVSALEGRTWLTRSDLKTILADNGIKTDVQRLAHIIIRAELDGLICSGPRRGKQFTYGLLEERVGGTETILRDQAVERLARRYFTSHGPAQVKDFSWWSGLSKKEADYAHNRIKSDLQKATIDGRTYWYSPHAEVSVPDTPSAFLLSIYDEYTIAYKDRRDISEARDIERLISMGNALTAVIVINGRFAGTWKRALKRETIEISLNPFRKFGRDEQRAVESEVTRYGKFFNIPAVIARGP